MISQRNEQPSKFHDISGEKNIRKHVWKTSFCLRSRANCFCCGPEPRTDGEHGVSLQRALLALMKSISVLQASREPCDCTGRMLVHDSLAGYACLLVSVKPELRPDCQRKSTFPLHEAAILTSIAKERDRNAS